MTHERNKYKKKHLDPASAIWKILDDYTGFYVYSNQITVDYQGLITKDGQQDVEPDAEHPPKIESDGDAFKRGK